MPCEGVKEQPHNRYGTGEKNNRLEDPPTINSGHLGTSVVLAQVQSFIHPGDLLRVSIERERGPLEEFADPPLLGLGPPRMVDFRIYISVEPVFIRCLLLPGVQRLLVGETDVDDGLDSLEAIRSEEHTSE